MTLRQVQIHRRVRQVGMAEQELNRAQVRAGFEQMRRVAWRSVCGVTCLSMPAFRVAICTASQITFAVIGVSARQPCRVPGKR